MGRLKEFPRLLEVPSAAALNERIVSSGRSIRGRVGLDRSGSAMRLSVSASDLQDLQDILIMLPSASLCWIVLKSSRFESWSATAAAIVSQRFILAILSLYIHGCASVIAFVGSAFVSSLFLSFVLSVRSSLLADRLLRREPVEAWLIDETARSIRGLERTCSYWP